MPYYIVASGTKLYKVNTSGTATELTLPSGVTIDSTRRARMAVLGRNVIVVNGATRSLAIDGDFNVRPLILTPPTSPVALTSASAGLLSGTFRVKYTNIIRDTVTSELLSESTFSPISASSGVIALKLLAAAGVAKSPESTVTHRRLYRTTTGPGSTYYPWVEVDGNVATAISDDTADAALSLLSASTDLGTAPGMLPGTFMTLIAAWKNRLWGVGDYDVDVLRYSGDGVIYGWPAANFLNIAPVGANRFGVTGLMPRRDEFGIAKRDVLWKITGSSPSNFSLIKVIEGKGCYAPDSVVIIRDIAYFLGEDGVYTWGPDGVKCISDEKVRAWFASDTYFNRAQYPNAFAKYNAQYHTYELHLNAAGSSSIDRWVSYDISRGIWYGPHLTASFTPSFGSQIIDTNDLTVPVTCGTNGTIYKQNQSGFVDDASAITLDMISKFHHANNPDIHKLWGGLSLISKIQSAAGNLAMAIRLGGLDAATTFTLTADMRLGRERFRVLGPGRFMQIEFTESTSAQGCELFGYEVPVRELGRR